MFSSLIFIFNCLSKASVFRIVEGSLEYLEFPLLKFKIFQYFSYLLGSLYNSSGDKEKAENYCALCIGTFSNIHL